MTRSRSVDQKKKTQRSTCYRRPDVEQAYVKAECEERLVRRDVRYQPPRDTRRPSWKHGLIVLTRQVLCSLCSRSVPHANPCVRAPRQLHTTRQLCWRSHMCVSYDNQARPRWATEAGVGKEAHGRLLWEVRGKRRTAAARGKVHRYPRCMSASVHRPFFSFWLLLRPFVIFSSSFPLTRQIFLLTCQSCYFLFSHCHSYCSSRHWHPKSSPLTFLSLTFFLAVNVHHPRSYCPSEFCSSPVFSSISPSLIAHHPPRIVHHFSFSHCISISPLVLGAWFHIDVLLPVPYSFRHLFLPLGTVCALSSFRCFGRFTLVPDKWMTARRLRSVMLALRTTCSVSVRIYSTDS